MENSLQEIIDQASLEMDEAIDFLKRELSHIRAGKASPSLLDGIKVDYYGSQTPIAQVANVSTPDARLITVQPWEKGMIAAIEKAIIASNLGLNPSNDGNLIRLPLPILSEERRRELVKVCRDYGEKAKVSIRNSRRDGNDSIKKTVKAESISEDFKFEAETEVQTITDQYIKSIDELLDRKEQEILTV